MIGVELTHMIRALSNSIAVDLAKPNTLRWLIRSAYANGKDEYAIGKDEYAKSHTLD